MYEQELVELEDHIYKVWASIDELAFVAETLLNLEDRDKVLAVYRLVTLRMEALRDFHESIIEKRVASNA